MPSIADQVATMEHDHADALVLIDQLNAANAALTSANTSLQRDNVALQLEVNDMKHYVDDTRAMAEQLAGSAYEMLRASRRQVGTPAEVIPFAPKKNIGDFLDGLNAKVAALPEQWPAQTAVHEIMAGDSGDEQPADPIEVEVDKALAESGQTPTPEQRAEIITAVREHRPSATPLPPHAGPMLVKHDGDLPMFLKRDAPYGAGRAIFG